MADWVLIPCLKALFTEFDRIAPARDDASDGSIGNAAHEAEVSDHNPDETGSVPIHDADHLNEVHAIDVDNNLNESDLTMEKVVQFLLGRRIWSASSGWVQKTYTGPSAHTEHAHFSASYTTSLEASTASWHLEDIPVALTSADKTWISQQITAAVAKVAADNTAKVDDLLNVKIGDLANPNRTVGDLYRDQAKLRGYLVGDAADTKNANIPESAPVAAMTSAARAALNAPAKP
jgi:hypothetical protein